MASVSTITLAITDGPTPTTSKVTVAGKLHFDATDVGKGYQLAIKILGEDKVGDALPTTDAVGDDNLYTFSWGLLFNQKPFKQVTVATAGEQTFSEARVLNSNKLDEDSGVINVPSGDINTPPFSLPRKDEIFAQVMLSGSPVSARSTTVNLGFGL